jgi:hypothetical protein
MRRPLLTLLALLLLLMQPVALLHALSHGTAGAAHPALAASAQGAAADADARADHAHVRTGLDCLQCLAFAAIGSAALPTALLLFRTPLLRQAAPAAAPRLTRGGTSAGYHARGPPVLA